MRQSENQRRFGALPLHEAMVCGIPAIVPDYSALSDWPTLQKTVDSVEYIPVTSDPMLNNNGINTIHRVINISAAIEALERLYQDEARRKELSEQGRKVALRYQWRAIGRSFHDIFIKAIQTPVLSLANNEVQVWKKGK